jgi:transcriptional antiterminator RfaH
MEPFVYPDDLMVNLAPPAPAAGSGDPWWVLHTRPRAEKSVARKFLSSEIAFFLPLYQKQWRSRGRLLSSYLPLFPAYLFVRGQDVRSEALQTNQVARVLPVPDQQRFAADLGRVYRLMQGGMLLAPEERFHPGTAVVIVDGPLAGLQGKVVRRGSRLRFFVEVEFLRRGVSVELEGWMIEPLSSPRSTPRSPGARGDGSAVAC